MGMRARIRAWLIDLVREAIRIEYITQAGLRAHEAAGNRAWTLNPVTSEIKPRADYPGKFKTPGDPYTIEPSFEQMQAEAIREQEAFYAPKQPRSA